MTTGEFNEKWKSYLEYGHYGMAIDNPKVIEYLDKEFEKEVKNNEGFTFSQIKTKFGSSRVYCSSDKSFEWEMEIDQLLKE